MIIVLFLQLFSFVFSKDLIVLNVFDSKSLFVANLLSNQLKTVNSLEIRIFGPKLLESVIPFQSKSFPDLSFGRVSPVHERISSIFDSLSHTLHSTDESFNSTLVISFDETVTPKFSENFVKKVFLKLSNKDILLLQKTERMTSISDWHDLMLFAFNSKSKGVGQFFSTFKEVYRHHASNRECCTLLEPRPALLEAITRHRPRPQQPSTSSDTIIPTSTDSSPLSSLIPVNVSYFSPEDVCVQAWSTEEHHTHHHHLGHSSNILDFCGSTSHPSLVEMLQFQCGDGSNKTDHICADIFENQNWKKRVSRGVPQNYPSLPRDQWETKLPNAKWTGSFRFRNATSARTPRRFCWDSGRTDYEEKSPSRVYFDWNDFKPYVHPTDEVIAKDFKSKLSVVMVSGSSGGEKLDQIMYPTIAKLYYAKRHGYQFLHLIDLPFRSFYDSDVFQKMPNPDWVSGYLSKIPMLLDTSFRFPDTEWIVWTDDDTWPNPGWSYLPLDAYLGDVPKDKVFVLGLYRSAFTNLFAVRNSVQGRRLLMDWLAVSLSGLIQCHGFDQAALQHLIFQRLYGSMVSAPFNHTCLYQKLTQEQLDLHQFPDIGCDNGGDFSCDFNFERDLYFTGFKTAKSNNFFNLKISSFSKGCANSLIPEFHVVTESTTHPRWQCGHCSRGDRIEASGHWDGPWGGGNDKFHLDGTINGWHFNHKAQVLFYELYLNPNTCKKMDNLLPPCYECKHSNCAGQSQSTHPHLVISLADGIGFDLDNFTYCSLSDPHMLKHQWTSTYMKDYQELIRIAKENYTNESWDQIYKLDAGGEGRDPCEVIGDPKCHLDSNQKDMYKRVDQGNYQDYFETSHYCEEICHVVPKEPSLIGRSWLGQVKEVVDCRTTLDIEREQKDSAFDEHLKDPTRRRRR